MTSTSPGPAVLQRRPRLAGVDLARSIALMGMVMAHIGSVEGPAGMMFDGLPSVLFAVLAGVSLSLIGDRPARIGGTVATRSTVGLLVRGILLVLLHLVLVPLAPGIFVVLAAIGCSYVLLAGVPRLPTRWVAALIPVSAAVAATVHALDPGRERTGNLLTGVYPLFGWTTYLLVGVVLARTLMRQRPGVLTVVAVVGAAFAVVGVGARPGPDLLGVSTHLGSDSVLGRALDPADHTAGLIDQVTSISAACAVIALCLLVTMPGVPARRVLHPLQAMGSMSLTVYALHVVTALPLAAVVDTVRGPGHPDAAVATVVVAVVGATLYRRHHDRGPLEAVNRALIDRACLALVPVHPPATPAIPDHPSATDASPHGTARPTPDDEITHDD